jgi:hypothetical protein
MILVLTNFDMVASGALFNIALGDPRQHESQGPGNTECAKTLFVAHVRRVRHHWTHLLNQCFLKVSR